MNTLKTFGDIIEGSYCVGCGVCAYRHPENIKMRLNTAGNFEPQISTPLSSTQQDDIMKICPFSDESQNEDDISRAVFSQKNLVDDLIGSYSGLFAGYSPTYRHQGSSGGVITWILARLLEQGDIDYVIHVKPSPPDTHTLFEYSISSSVSEVIEGGKSKYYPIELSQVLSHIHQHPGRYALVALPCFTKAVRNLAHNDHVVGSKITYYIGLVCGHLKSTYFAEALALQTGIPLDALQTVDFRVKDGSRHANKYFMEATGKSSVKRLLNRRFIAGNWGLNFFRNPACNYCDDVFAETADIVIGDAWIDPFASDPKGTSIILVRSDYMAHLVKLAILSKDLVLSECSLSQIVKSQRSGLADRREGLAYRLFLNAKNNRPSPIKRVAPSRISISLRRKLIYRSRLLSETYSTKSFQLARKYNSYLLFFLSTIPIRLIFSSLYFFYIPVYARVVIHKLKQRIQGLKT
jgi:coenzyme F420-reducing hydrogenase beta subunit